MAEQDKKASTDVHFCVLVHGLWGSPSHLAQLTKALHAAYPGDQLHTLVPKRNSGNYTYDGIEKGGERVTHEVEEELDNLAKTGKNVTKLSVVGYSLGGLIARYAIGLLYSAGVFDRITPMNFTTFATPHLGTRTPLLGWNNHIFNVLGARTLSLSGQQLWLIDNFRESGRPLLALLADPNSVFIRALSGFKHRHLYANIINDRAVPFYTACISRIDPFPDIDNLILNTVPETDDVILQHPQGDYEHNSDMVTPRTGERTYYEAFAAGTRNAWNKAPFYFFLTTLAPLGIVAFMANAGVQSFRSAQRIKDHEEGAAGTDFSKYKLPEKVVEAASQRAEKMFGEISHEQDADTVESGNAPPEHRETSSTNGKQVAPNGSPNGHAKGPTVEPPRANGTATTTSSGTTTPTPSLPTNPPNEHLAETSETALERSKSASLFPTLALTPIQFEIVDSLDAVGWRKYPVHIQRANHSHAALIVRMQRPGFGEGRIVSRHWCERFKI